MIDLSFAKIAVVEFVALLILGPEKLPYAARTVGTLLGRMQRYITNVKSEVTRDIEIEELRKAHAEMSGLGRNVADQLSESVNEAKKEIEASADMESQDRQAKPALTSRVDGTEQKAVKERRFRQHRLALSSSVPSWYKRQGSSESRITPAVSSVIRRRNVRYSITP